ncbi:histone-fold-containing protein [Vararia minispora EC-137]|uniref:Histone-fold-containing protein n=1 Tax=Vararia minispora EC-137 TaxID=1314806 RepID=A0ACB8QJQ5_9AGAM|nr:histone-fold-containing protein [Vararia minispora EC-137]
MSAPSAPTNLIEAAPKRKIKPLKPASRELGKSLFPVARVQRVLKEDKELPSVAKDAVFLISMATEEFIKRFTEACHNVAAREKRVTVQPKDVASVVRRADEFLFLEEIIPWPDPSDVPQRRKPGLKRHDEPTGPGPTMLDTFVNKNVAAILSDNDILTNEDGTLQSIGRTDFDEIGE